MADCLRDAWKAFYRSETATRFEHSLTLVNAQQEANMAAGITSHKPASQYYSDVQECLGNLDLNA